MEKIRSRIQRRARGEYRSFEHVRPGICFLQHDYDLANQAGAAFRSDANSVLSAIVSLNSGATAPTTMFAYMLWADTANSLLKQRNAANTLWIVRGSLKESFVQAKSGTFNIGIADFGQVFNCTGTFTVTATAAATLGDGFFFSVRNNGTGNITLDPNSTETIDGQLQLFLRPGESALIWCNGTAFITVGLSRQDGAIASGRNVSARTNAATPNTKFDMAADEFVVRDSNGLTMVLPSVAVTVDMGVVGANGIDASTQAASTWYYGWVIAKPDGTIAGLASTSATAPTMPSGYTFKALLTAARSNGSTQFVKYRQFGNWCYYEAGVNIQSGGTATTETSVVYSSAVPSIALSYQVDFYYSNGTNPSEAKMRVVSGQEFFQVGNGTSAFNSHCAVVAPNTGTLYYLNNGASGSANFTVEGYKLPLGGE